ncbi:MAG: HlyD family efflux transporter periplasmic adaptor subunit [Planctomycetota bacterium]|nr:HlyD family efflux transporter periplasmic adaptor subunit [Planctomycetota bacterium]
MRRGLVIPLISLALLTLAIYHVARTSQDAPPLDPPQSPPRSPYAHRIAGLGLVEAATENISIGTHVPGIVGEVWVEVGQTVAAGDRLFQIDDRQARADLQVREAALVAANAQLERLEQLPRPEELPASSARVREAAARLSDEEVRTARAEKLFERKALSEEELTSRRQMLQMAREQHTRSVADDDLLRSGTWEPDKVVARAAVARAESEVAQQKMELARLTVTAPVDGTVLQLNVRRGEYVQQGAGQALLVLGRIDPLHVRVNIDEEEITRFREEAKTTAYLRGKGGEPFELKFVRVEPLVTPKRSLTGAPNERVDTRVLQVIYSVRASGRRLFVGQQFDVFIEADDLYNSAGKSHIK